MYQDTNTKFYQKLSKGFTLVELLVASAIMGLVGIVAVQLLYDSVSYRAKQRTIEDASEDLRQIARIITSAVVESQNISVVSPHEIRVVSSSSCHTFRYDSADNSVKLAKDPNYPCAPPDTGFYDITSADMVVTDFNVYPVGDSVSFVTIEIEGEYKNSVDSHSVRHTITATPRI